MPTIVAGTVELPAEKRAQALSEAADLMRDTRSQKGCNHYVWSADPSSDTIVYVYEHWETTEDFANHLANDYYLKMLQHMGSYEVSNAQVSKFEIGRTQAVYNAEGLARADFWDE